MANPNTFADYVSSTISLDTLETLTDDIDKDIEESQRVLNEIKTLLNNLQTPKKPQSSLRHEDISNFLEADEPNLLLPDMAKSMLDVDMDDVIATMKSYAEDLKKNCCIPEVPSIKVSGPDKEEGPDKELIDLDLDQYAFSLDQLGKRLANIKLNKSDETVTRNVELEEKLTQLCEDVNNFTQMVQAKTRLTESNKSWPEYQHVGSILHYNDVVTKLLSGINEVIFLRQKS